MKLSIVSYVYEPPALQITPETEYESAVLNRYWKSAKLSIGYGESDSHNGKTYVIRFEEPPKPAAKEGNEK